jgi:hypothetical protein
MRSAGKYSLPKWQEQIDSERQCGPISLPALTDHLEKAMNVRPLQTGPCTRLGMADRATAAIGAVLRAAPAWLIGAAGVSLLVGGLIVTAAPETTVAEVSGDASAQATIAAVFTGQYVEGVPVYRLPPIAVVADRKAELSRMEHEEQVKRIRQARVRVATKPPE